MKLPNQRLGAENGPNSSPLHRRNSLDGGGSSQSGLAPRARARGTMKKAGCAPARPIYLTCILTI
jgi:hypothetical protein